MYLSGPFRVKTQYLCYTKGNQIEITRVDDSLELFIALSIGVLKSVLNIIQTSSNQDEESIIRLIV